jgi:crotonobetainyl-CoA:carnitine CoA-transferase CaiB-like acyl-CoA transferase
MTTTSTPGPLHGVRVLDLSRVLAGPFATMMLADLGADVVKIESPEGDDTRRWGPPWVGGESAYFTCVNRNKRDLVLDFRHDAARDALRRLVATADVLIENFKVGTMERWGLGYESLREIRPELVYCSITGYGRTGPHAHLPGYDPILEAVGGFMSINGEEGGRPLKVGVAVIDVLAGSHAAFGITAALAHAWRTGEGQRVDLSLFESSLAALANQASAYLMGGVVHPRLGNAHPHIVPTNSYATVDGPVMVCVGNDPQFRKLTELLGAPELAADPRFATNPDRVAHRDDLDVALRALFAVRSGRELTERANAVGVPVAPILELDEVFEHPQVAARDMLLDIDHPTAGRFKQVGFPVKLDRTPPSLRYPPPLLGQHTIEVLREAGLADDEIATITGAPVPGRPERAPV